jgi:hypothetical protein
MITVSPARAALSVGEIQRFTAAAYDQDNHEMWDIDLEWTSGNETVGTIGAMGIFTAIAAGDATITAKNVGVTGTAEITVSSPELVPTPAPYEVQTEAQPTPTCSPSPSPSPALQPAPTSPVPKATPESPGFGGLFVVIGVVLSCAVKRRGV